MLHRLAVDLPVDLDLIRTFAREEPLVFAAAAAAAILVLIALGALIRFLRRPPGARFLRILSRPDAITVLMHPNPDPDAMAAALGVARLAAHVGTTAEILYPGQIRHQENRAFRTVLDCEFESLETADDLRDVPVVLVDHNEPRGFPGCDHLEPYAVVDHHPGVGTGSAFTDVRPDYGACASIIAEYYEDLGAVPGDPEVPATEEQLPSLLATGLLYGILADTKHLTKGCTPAEFEASAYLYPGVDQDALERIANPQVDAEILDVRARAISERDVRGPFAVSYVGTVSNVDAIPQAAEELLELEGITAVIVMGEKNETLHLSGRSRDDRVHMGNVLNGTVTEIPMSSAGGHARMAGGQVSTAHLQGLRPDSGMTREDLVDRLFDAMTGDV